MKNYYQLKKKGGGFLLHPSVYRKTVNEIGCYHYFKELIKSIEEKSEMKITENDIAMKIVAERYVAAIEDGIVQFVPEEFRNAAWEHVVDKIDYETLCEKYNYSATALKPYVQAFIFGVANLLGEDFTKN